MIHIFLAPGFEEIEALSPLDVLLRLGKDVRLVSTIDSLTVSSAHGVQIVCDCLFADANLAESEALILPGGMPGAKNLLMHAGLRDALIRQNDRGGLVCAICAAPMVLGAHGILRGRKATCYPGFEDHLDGATYTAAFVESDANVITGCGPAAALSFGFAIAERFVSKEQVAQLKAGMQVNW